MKRNERIVFYFLDFIFKQPYFHSIEKETRRDTPKISTCPILDIVTNYGKKFLKSKIVVVHKSKLQGLHIGELSEIKIPLGK